MRFSWPACLLLRTDLVVLPLGRRDLCGAVDRQATRTSPIFESPIQILVRILYAAHFGKVLQSRACIQRTALNQDIFTNQHEKIIESRCVCVFSSHSFWTSSSLDVPAGVTQEEGHTGFIIHLLSAVRAFVFLARRIQPFLSLVNREVEYCVLMI